MSMENVKIVFVGNKSIGMTSLLISYTENRFPVDYVPTVFDNFTTGIEVDNKLFNVALWDTGGQQEYPRLRALSYPETDIFVLCYNVLSNDSLCSIKFWAQEVSHHSPSAKLVIAGLKKDLLNDPKKVEKYYENLALPGLVEHIKDDIGAEFCITCSALTQDNLKTLFDNTIRAAVQPIDYSNKQDFIKSCARGDVEYIIKAVELKYKELQLSKLVNRRNETTLYIACANNHAKIANILLQHVSTKIKNEDNYTCIDIACINDNVEVIKVLFPKFLFHSLISMERSDNIISVASSISKDKLKQYIEEQKKGKTPLEYAKIKGNIECIKNIECILKYIKDDCDLPIIKKKYDPILIKRTNDLLLQKQKSINETWAKAKLTFKKREEELYNKLSVMIIEDKYDEGLLLTRFWCIIIGLRNLQLENKITWPREFDAFSIANINEISLSSSSFKSILPTSKVQIKRNPLYFKGLSYENEAIILYAQLYDIIKQYNSIKKKTQIDFNSSCIVQGIGFKGGILKSEYSSILGNFEATKIKGQAGSSIVHSLNGIHFKRSPHAPGVEYMVSSMGDILAREGASPTTLIRVIGTSGEPLIYQASLTIEGECLQNIIQTKPHTLDKLSLHNFTSMIFLSILTDPQDGKPDNYMVEKKFNKMQEIEKMKIIGIDNDIAFSDLKIRKHDEGCNAGKYFINIKNILYFFPQMSSTISSKFKEKFLSVSPEIIVITWLSSLIKQNKKYDELLQQRVFTKKEYSGSLKTGKGLMLPISFSPNTVYKIYKKLLLLYEVLYSNTIVTHQDILEYVQPQLANHYKQVFKECNGDIMKSINSLYYNSVSDSSHLQNLIHDAEKNKSKSFTQIVLKTAQEFDFEYTKTQSVQDGILEFINSITWTKLPKMVSPSLLYSELDKLFYESFNCSFSIKICEEKLIEPLKWLIDEDLCDFQKPNSQGYTCLHYSCAVGFIQGVKLLLKLPYSMDLLKKRTSLNKSPKDLAVKRNQKHIIKVLDNYLKQYE